MTGSSANTLSQDSVERQLATMRREINQLKAIVQGQPIRAARIEAVSGGAISTGTIIIKDGVDGAILSIRDAGNNEIGTIDEDGIHMFDGEFVFDNESGDPVLDELGIVSENNFVHDTAVDINDARTISATSFTNVASTNLSFTLLRTTVILFFVSGNFSGLIADGENCTLSVGLDISGTMYPDSGEGFGQVFSIADDTLDDVTNVYPSWSDMVAVTLPAGSYTARLKAKKESGSVDGQVTNTKLTYVLLGK